MRKTIKKYQRGGDVIDTTLFRKYDPKSDSVLNKNYPGKTPKSLDPSKKTPSKKAAPKRPALESEMIKELNKKGAMPPSKTNIGRKGIKVGRAKGGKQMMKRADGSTSQRGLWDNIRAAAKRNKAAGKPGKKPTAAMLKQERKIKAKSKK